VNGWPSKSIHQEAMREDHGQAVSAAVVEPDALAVHFGKWHRDLGVVRGRCDSIQRVRRFATVVVHR
jgi:hypothetical protein